MLEYLTWDNILIFAVFLAVMFILYKLFKVGLKLLLIAGVGFAFPWIVKYLGIDLPVSATIETGLVFAGLGAGLYLIYTFSSAIITILKIITWPIRYLFKRAKKSELSKLRKEIKDGKKKS